MPHPASGGSAPPCPGSASRSAPASSSSGSCSRVRVMPRWRRPDDRCPGSRSRSGNRSRVGHRCTTARLPPPYPSQHGRPPGSISSLVCCPPSRPSPLAGPASFSQVRYLQVSVQIYLACTSGGPRMNLTDAFEDRRERGCPRLDLPRARRKRGPRERRHGCADQAARAAEFHRQPPTGEEPGCVTPACGYRAA